MKKLSAMARITEVGDTAHRLVSLYKSTATLKDEAFLKPLFVEMEEKANALTEAVKRDAVISQLENADAKRDGAIRVLDRLLKGYKTIPVDTLKAYGVQLSAVFKKYGMKMTVENYSSQSNLVDSLLQDLSDSDKAAAIAALPGIAEAIDNIKTAQEEFVKIRANYDKGLAQKGSKETATSLRKPLLELINNKLLTYLSAMKIANPTKYKVFSEDVAVIITSVNETIKARKKNKEKTP
ncbi:MAG: DUF6261 family protein [Bergeyella cardium]